VPRLTASWHAPGWLFFRRQLVDGVASGRGLSEERVKELVDEAPLNAKTAAASGLVDALMYPDQVPARLAVRGMATGAS
jgi:protease IV